MMMSKGGKRVDGMAESEGSVSSSCGFEGDLMAAAAATAVKVIHKDFALLRQEWAATRIQTLFRAFLVTNLHNFLYQSLLYGKYEV